MTCAHVLMRALNGGVCPLATCRELDLDAGAHVRGVDEGAADGVNGAPAVRERDAAHVLDVTGGRGLEARAHAVGVAGGREPVTPDDGLEGAAGEQRLGLAATPAQAIEHVAREVGSVLSAGRDTRSAGAQGAQALGRPLDQGEGTRAPARAEGVHVDGVSPAGVDVHVATKGRDAACGQELPLDAHRHDEGKGTDVGEAAEEGPRAGVEAAAHGLDVPFETGTGERVGRGVHDRIVDDHRQAGPVRREPLFELARGPATGDGVVALEGAALDENLPARKEPTRLAPGDAVGGLDVQHDDRDLHKATMSVQVDTVNPKRRALTRAEAEALLKAVRRKKARASLHDFIRYAWHVLEPGGPMQDGWHIKAIADHVQWQLEERAKAVADPAYKAHEVVQNLLVNIPPRCLKSRIISVCATAWAWLHWPHLRILVLSTNPRVCSRDGLAALTLIRSPFYQELIKGADGKPEWTLEKDGVQEFSNTKGGTRAAHGLGGNITGEGCDWMIVDDPHDARDTLDAIIKTCEEYDTAIGNRINDPRTSIRTGVMQRINAADWAAAMLAQGWLHLCLPMEYEEARACRTPMPVDDKGRYAPGASTTWADPRPPGAVLHKRFTREFLAKERLRLGEYGYAGQMQQRPAPLEGGMYKRAKLRFWRPDGMSLPDIVRRPAGCVSAHEHPAEIVPCVRNNGRDTGVPEFDFVTLSVDCAVKKTDTGSRVGLVVIAGRGVKRYVLHDHTRPLDFNGTIAAIRELRENYPGVPFTYRCSRVLVEDKANGPAAMNVLQAEVSGLIEVQPEGGKESRAAAMSPTIEAGQLYLLEGAAWSDELVEELCTFPNGRHDDRVDALSQAITYHAQSDDLLGLLQLCSA